MKYADQKTPDNYVCGKCGKSKVKLWRRYQVFLDQQELFCADCALENQDEEGPVDKDRFCIGWLVAAVPTEDEETYWGYTSVPEDGVLWWRNLPTNKDGIVKNIINKILNLFR